MKSDILLALTRDGSSMTGVRAVAASLERGCRGVDCSRRQPHRHDGEEEKKEATKPYESGGQLQVGKQR